MMLVALVKQWIRYMLKALVTGGSTGFGSVLVDKLSKTYEVEVVPREVLSSLEVGYNARKGDYDLVFFNHHYMPEEFDHKSYEMNCLVCLHILNSINLNNNAKVGWMLSKGIGAHFMPQYSPYFAFKSVNLHVMRYLNHKEAGRKHFGHVYFGVEPGHLVKSNWQTTADAIIKMLPDVTGGNVYELTGQVSNL